MEYTLFDKVWSDHVVTQQDNGADLLHIDRIFLHERTGSTALISIDEGGRKIKNPSHVFCTMDHIVDTFPGRTDQTTMPGGSEFIKVTRDLSLKGNITLLYYYLSGQSYVHARWSGGPCNWGWF
jgi:3-isopropylmalate/(R)-2-methylmalate dehydratase large subunit